MVSCDTYTVAVGGYNIAAIESARVAKDVDYISTAVVAFLEYVEGKDLSAFAALSNLPTNSSL
jgi:3-phosphoglycerate kinase